MIMQDGNNSNVKFEKAKHTQFGRKGMGHYNQICLMAKTAQSFRSGQEEQDKAQEKEVPVHVRLFGKKASPKEGYKSDNRDWQKGLRGKANNEINEYETGNYLSDAAYAKKKQLELLKMLLLLPREKDLQMQRKKKKKVKEKMKKMIQTIIGHVLHGKLLKIVLLLLVCLFIKAYHY